MQSRSNEFDGGTLEIEVSNLKNINNKNITDRTRFIPSSASIGINFGDISYNIRFSVPAVADYFFELKDGNEVKIYIDGEFYCGGYFIGRKAKENSWEYTCLGYGYEINKTFCIPLSSFSANMNVGTFILQTIKQNLIKRNQKTFIQDEELRQTRIAIFDSPISFVLYDPNNYGDEIIPPATESKFEERILSYLNKFLKPKNIFIRCLGELQDVRDFIRDKVINNRKNNNIISDPLGGKKIFILELYKATTRQTGSSSVLDPTKKVDFSIKSTGSIYDNIINQQPSFEIDYSKRYGCYFATSKNPPTTNSSTNNTFATDPVISDGTAKVITFDLNLDKNGLQKLLNYEVNKRIAESFTYNCTVIGYRQGLNINNVNNGIEKTGLAFWDINSNVKVTDHRNGMRDNQFLIKSITLNWGTGGATTNIACTLPNAYSQEDTTKLENTKEYLKEVLDEEERKINLLKPNFALRTTFKILDRIREKKLGK